MDTCPMDVQLMNYESPQRTASSVAEGILETPTSETLTPEAAAAVPVDAEPATTAVWPQYAC